MLYSQNRFQLRRAWTVVSVFCVIFLVLSLITTFGESSQLSLTLQAQKISTLGSSLSKSCVNSYSVPADDNLHVQEPTISEDPTFAAVLGPPTPRFRDNLRNDTKYLTSWTGAGWTNDVMTFTNLIYLAMISGRVPIIPAFTPDTGHMKRTAPLPFSQIFNMSRLSNAIGIPVLDWQDVKVADTDSQELEAIGCWSVWATMYFEHKPRISEVLDQIGLDVSYTSIPEESRLHRGGTDPHTTFWALAALAFPDRRAEELGRQPPRRPAPKTEAVLPPDEHLACYDYLYYVSTYLSYEYDYDYSPAWRNVMVHMHFTDRLTDIADDHIRRVLNVPSKESTPPWIAIHIRRSDFKVHCEGRPFDECYAPFSAYERRVHEVREELSRRKGVEVPHVIMTSDETDPAWWAEVARMGWTRIDYAAEQTVEIYGEWYPILIDVVVQSHAAGFVGTDRSTMSLIAGRRVESWTGGPTRMVKWGWPGADDH